MRLIKAILNDILSYGTNVVIDFEWTKSPTMIQGYTKPGSCSNGAGKTAMFECFHWCLVGDLIRKVGRVSEVIRNGAKSCSAYYKFSFNGKIFEVTRERTASKEKIFFAIDGQLHEFHDAKQGTERLFEFMGITPEILSLACFSGDGFPTFTRMKPSERADFIDILAQGQKWEKGRLLMVQQGKALAKDLETLEASKGKLTLEKIADNRLVDEKIEKVKKEKDQIEADKKKLEEDLLIVNGLHFTNVTAQGQAEYDLSKLETPKDILDEINVVNEEMLPFSTEMHRAKIEIGNIDREILTLAGRSPKDDPEIKETEKILQENNLLLRQHDITLRDVNRDIERLKKLKDQPLQLGAFENEKNRILNEMDTGLCSSCGQKLPHTHDETKSIDRLAQLEEEISKATTIYNTDQAGYQHNIGLAEEIQRKTQAEIDRLTSENVTIGEVLSGIGDDLKERWQKEKEDLIVKKRGQEAVVTENSEALLAAKEMLKELQEKVGVVETQRTGLLNKIKSLKDEQIKLERDRTNLQEAQKRLENSTVLAVLESEIKAINDRVKATDDKIGQIDLDIAAKNKEWVLTKYWAQGFADIRYSLFNSTIQNLQELMNNFCIEQGLDFEKVEIDTWKVKADNKAKPEINIYVVRDGHSLSVGGISKGEGRRVHLAGFFSMASLIEHYLGFKIELCVIDEITDGLDGDGKESIMGIIMSQAENHQIFVVDHDPTFKSLFSNVITVKREPGSTSTVSIQ